MRKLLLVIDMQTDFVDGALGTAEAVAIIPNVLREIAKHDKRRSRYHDYFCKGGKWGECKTYDLCINSSRLGIEGTVEFLYEFVNKFRIQNSEFRG